MTSSSHRARVIAIPLLVALATSGCVQRRAVVPCAAPQPVAAPAPHADEVSLRIDYAGAEAMVAALDRDTLSDAAVDSLLDVHGVSMMVDNVALLVPGVERADFRTAIQGFVRTGRVADEHVHFNLWKARSERKRIRTLVTHIRESEQAVLERTLAIMAPYAPETGPLDLIAYLMAGGTSTGFVRTTPEGDVFYYNLADAGGDCEAAMLHIAHETFHLVQKAGLRRAGLAALADSAENLPLPERTLLTVVLEGTADLVADPNRFGGDGPEVARQRERYRHDAEPARIREDFALFDTTFQQAVGEEIPWREVLDRGFMSEPRFYALGREMAKAIELHCGPECIRRLLGQPPVEFFRQYIRLYTAHPEITGRFAPETERMLIAGGWSDRSEARLVSDVASIRPGEPFTVGFHVTLDEGWRTPWKNAGDVGNGLLATWTLPGGFSADSIAYPIPERIGDLRVASYGYTDEVVFLATITPPADLEIGRSVRLGLSADFVVCGHTCLPAHAERSLELPVRDAPPTASDDAALIRRYADRLPVEHPHWTTRAARTDGGLVLGVAPPADWEGSLAGAWFFPADPALLDHAADQPVERTAAGEYRVRLTRSAYLADGPARIEGVLVLPDGAAFDAAGHRGLVVRAAVADAEVPWAAEPTEPVGAPTGSR